MFPLRSRLGPGPAKPLPRAAVAVFGLATVLLFGYAVLARTSLPHRTCTYEFGWPFVHLIWYRDARVPVPEGSWLFWPRLLVANLGVAAGLSLFVYVLIVWQSCRPHRVWQVSVRELMTRVVMVAVAASLVTWHLQDVAREERIVEELRAAGVWTESEGRPLWIVRPLRQLGIADGDLPEWLLRTTAVRYGLAEDIAVGAIPRSAEERQQRQELAMELGQRIGQLQYCEMVDFTLLAEPLMPSLTDERIAALLLDFRHLRALCLRSELATDRTAVAIAVNCPRLHHLLLDVPIGDEGIVSLAGLPDLKDLILPRSCRVTAEGRRRLLKQTALFTLVGPACWEDDCEFMHAVHEARIFWCPRAYLPCECLPD